MAITEAPKIITGRIGYDDSHTLERYLATGGYDGLRKALAMTPEAVAAEVDTASLLGRGGAGFPAGRKWAMLRKSPVTYLVVNGDESEPATFKDHLLVERDPHQLIEGVVIAAYALQVSRAFIYLRGEFALGLERVQARPQRRLRPRGGGGRHLRLGLLGRRRGPPGGRRLHLRRGDRPPRVAGGQARLPPDQAAVLPGRHRPLRRSRPWSTTSRPCPTCRGSCSTAGRPSPPSGEGRSTGTRLFALAGHVNNPGVYEIEMVKTTFRDLIYAPVLGGGIPHGRELKAFIPGGVSAPWFGPDQVDLPLGQDEVAAGRLDARARARSWSWTTTPAWSGPPGGSPSSSPGSRAGSAPRAGRARAGSSGSWSGSRPAQGREEDLDLLLDVCDNIAPGLTWPPQQTTICVLGPSIPSSIGSAIRMFRDEFLVHIKEGGCPYG